MKAHTIVALAASALLYFPTASASEQSNGRCIHLWLDGMHFDSMMPDPSRVHKTTREKLTGTFAMIEAYMDRHDSKGRPILDPTPTWMYIYATESGRYVMRIDETLPPYVGWGPGAD